MVQFACVLMFMYVDVGVQACEGQRLTLCVFLNYSPLIYSYLWGKTLSEPRSSSLAGQAGQESLEILLG